jgi:hypothetical protein
MSYHVGLPPQFPWMAVLFLATILIGIPTLGIVVAVAWRSRGSGPRGGGRSRGPGTGPVPGPRPPAPGGGPGAVGPGRRFGLGPRSVGRAWMVPESYRRRARAARLTGAGIGAITGLELVLTLRVDLAPVACVAGYLLGVLVGELWGWAPSRGAIREASLRERRSLDFAPAWAVLLAGGAALPVLAAPLALALAPRLSYRSWQPAPGITLPGGRLSWPGLGTTVPLAVVAAAALVLAGLSLRRLAQAPPLADAGDPAADAWWRRSAGRAALGAVVGIEALCLGATLILASAGLAIPGTPGSALYAASRWMIWAGLAVAAGGLLVWLRLDGPGRVTGRRAAQWQQA